jgi:hypothetical protein
MVMIGLALLLDGIGILWLGLVLLTVCGISTTLLYNYVKRRESPEKAVAGVPQAGQDTLLSRLSSYVFPRV